MATKKQHPKAKRNPLIKNSLTKEQEAGLNTFSSIAAVLGLSASVIAAVELSLPVMVIAALVGAASAFSKLFASKQGAGK